MENLSQPISSARLAANRANARKSTGPRTAAGKARAASNSLQHGLYSLTQFEDFLGDNNLALAVADNLLAEHQPVTPTEHFLVHQLIHCQLRFLQMQDFYKKSIASGSLDSAPHLPLILRELDRLPSRTLRLLKALQKEKDSRDENTEIEAIPDLPPIPERRPHPSETQFDETNPPIGPSPSISPGNRIFRLLLNRINEESPKPAEGDPPMT